jgi:type IV fimbrial biogenesis protein FimT
LQQTKAWIDCGFGAVLPADSAPNLVHQQLELVNVFKTAVNAGKTHVGDFVEFFEFPHDQFANAGAGHLAGTQVELMVVVAIAAVLIAMAVPSFTGLIKSNQVSSVVNTFMSDVRFARSEAIKRGGSVVICRSDAPEAASPVCSTSGNASNGNGWVSGWVIFQDLNNDGTIDAGEAILRIQPAITSVDVMTENTTTPRAKAVFTATGRLQSVGSVLKFQVGGNPAFSNEQQRRICLGLGGRARIVGDGTSACTG